MSKWVLFAILATLFAGTSSIFSKVALSHSSPWIGIFLRTSWVFLIVTLYALIRIEKIELQSLSWQTILLYGGSGLATALSWILYYHAIKIGPVSYASALTKASVLVTIFLSITILKEPLSWRLIVGTFLVLAGVFLLVHRQ